MAVTQNTLIGRSRGSVGGVTFSKWKGLNVIKSKPEQVENPQTIAQQTQRNRLALMVLLYRKAPALLQVGFKELAINQSEYNAFVSENIMSATQVGTPPAVDLVPAALQVSKGPLSQTPIDTMGATAGAPDVTFNFPTSPIAPDQAASDLAYAIVINNTTGEVGQNLGVDLRSDGTTTVSLGDNLASGDDLDCYLFFKEDGADRVSDSVYANVVVA